MSFINPISFGDYSSQQDNPSSFTLKELNTSNTYVVSAKRFTYGGLNDATGVDISSLASINGQVVTLSDFWLPTADPKSPGGMYRIQIVGGNVGGGATDECNVFVNLLY